MEPNLLSLITRALSPDVVQAVSKNLGETESGVHTGFAALIPALLGGLMAKSATPSGAANVFSTVTNANVDTGLLGNLGSLLGSGQSGNLLGVGSSMLSGLFGADKTAGLGAALAGITGLKTGSASNLAMMAAPIVFGYIKKFVTDRGMNAGSLGTLLAAQKEHLAGKLDPALTSALGLGSPAALLGSAAAPVRTVAAAGGAATLGMARWLPWLIGLVILIGLLWYFLGRGAATAPVVTSAPAAASVQFPIKVYFDTGKSEIGPEAKAAIQSAAAALAKNSSTKVDLTGYTDKTGDTAINEELSKNRALAVKAALEAAGIATDRIDTKPPAYVEVGAAGSDAEARRVDISSR